MANVEELFQAAVNVIKNLPTNGPYQPSTAMMLQFYGLYKQATEGPCPNNRPPFWDVVGKAKWGGWNQYRHLTKEQAKEMYVEKLKAIIDTMSFTENVQNFVGSLSSLENISLDELDMVSPGIKKRIESHPNSPFNSRTNSPQHNNSHTTNIVNGIEPNLYDHNMLIKETSNDATAININSTKPPQINGILKTDKETNAQSIITATDDYSRTNGSVDQSDDEEYVDPFDIQTEINENLVRHTEILNNIQNTVTRMNADILTLNHNIKNVEKTIIELPQMVGKNRSSLNHVASHRKHPRWWPFRDISPQWFLLLIVWPFIIRRVASILSPKQRK